MKKLIYIQEKFLDPSQCQTFIDLAKRNKKEIPYGDESRGGDTYLTSVEMSTPESDGNYGAIYLGGDVDSTVVDGDTVDNVTSLCKSFDSDIVLDYVGVVRWPVGTFMKPHFDKNDIHGEDVFAAMLYLNDDFDGGEFDLEVYSPAIEKRYETFKLKPNTALFFKSDQWHRVRPVKSGVRKSIVGWVLGKQWK